MKVIVDGEIFERFSGLTIGVIAIKDCNNSTENQAVADLLSKSVSGIQEQWSAEKIGEDSRILSWREAYRSFGAKPKKYKSSIENLIGTIVGGREMSAINTLVDLYNLVSLNHLIPVGGDDIDQINGDISLTFAEGDERFIPLNGTECMSPKAGEVIYRDFDEVLCRRWNWRECDKSKLTEDSKNVALVLEGLPPVTKDEILAAANELAESVLQHCGGSVDVKLLNSENQMIEI